MSFVLTLVTDESAPRDVVALTRAALAEAPPGSVAVQVRHKHAGAHALVELCTALLPVCRAHEARLIVNDRADVARAVGADGAQLPEQGLRVSDARRVLGPHALIGRSCHDRAGLERAEAEGADFAILAPIFAVPGRKNAPLGLDGLARCIEGLALPVHALGGIDASSIGSLRAAGAAGVAVIRAVYAAPDPAHAMRSLLAGLT